MVSYATVGSADLERAKSFYDALLTPIGMRGVMEHPSGGRIYADRTGRMFGVLAPHNGEAPAPGNGTMAGFGLPSRDSVRDFHARALALGATCEGEPGLRNAEQMGLFFAYVRDLDGNKLCAYRIGSE